MSDELLIVLSRRGQVGHATYRHYVDELSARPETTRWVAAIEHHATVTLNSLAGLGHVVVAWSDGVGTVTIAPRVLARLPRSGPPTAVLVGHRTAETEMQLREKCLARGVRFEPSNDDVSLPLLPRRLAVEADAPDVLAMLARDVEAHFDPEPAAWRILHAASSLDEYLGSLAWRRLRDLHGWEREDFDPTTHRFAPSGEAGQRDGLASYQDSSTGRKRFWLREGERTAETDRDWGRYAALARAGRSVLRMTTDEDLLVPLTALLPVPLATAASLCSGRAPRHVRLSLDAGPSRHYLAYAGVPHLIAAEIARKLAQELLPVPTLETARVAD
jgi:hypothetical protein